MQRRLPPHALSVTHAEGHAIQRMFREFGQVLSRPWARVVIITVFLEGAFVFGGFAFFATHLHTVHGLSLSAAGIVVMLFGAGGFLFATRSAAFVIQPGQTRPARLRPAFIFGLMTGVARMLPSSM